MTGKIYRPDQKHPEPYQEDLGPDAGKGINWGDVGERDLEETMRTAKDLKDVHALLQEYNDDELDRIPILPAGARLETNATYINLQDSEIQEFTADGSEVVSHTDRIVPKKGVDYELWNRLIGSPTANEGT